MSFPLFGNDKIKLATENFLKTGKLPHAVLVVGDKGLGKHTLAAYLAKAAVCSGDNKPCGSCHACRMADALSHPDIIKIHRESGKKELSVGIIREMRADAFIKPHEAERKVYIVEDADSMNLSAQNALLKVLEEPPEYVMFILLAERKASLLPTVISRCTAFSLVAPSVNDAKRALEGKTDCDGAQIEAAIVSAHQNVGKTLAILQKSGKNAAYDAAAEFINYVYSNDGYNMLKVLSRFEKDRVLADEFLSELKAEIAKQIKSLPKNGMRAKQLFKLYSDCDRYAEHLKAYANLPLLFCGMVADINEYRG